MESENSIHIARPKILRRLNLEACPKFTQQGDTTLSPMTNLAQNLSGTSLDATPKRRTLSNENVDLMDETNAGSRGSLGSEISEKENSYTSIVPYPPIHASPDKSKIISDDFISRRSPARRQALARIDVNSPIKANFVKPAQPVSSSLSSSTRLPSIEDADSQDSGCYPEDTKHFKYPEPLCQRRMSDRNMSPASNRTSSSLSAGGSIKYDGPAKLDFSFMSNGDEDDEGLPDELLSDDNNMPASSSLCQLIATPLSERATRQFSHDESPPAAETASPVEEDLAAQCDFLRVPKESFARPSFRRAHSMFDSTTPNARSSSFDSPLHQSPVARGFCIQDEDTGSSPLAPLGLHAARLRMKPSRVIQPIGGPPSKRSEPCAETSAQVQQENKRRKDDSDERPVFKSLELNGGKSSSCAATRLPHRIQRCHSETEATIMRALQRSSEEPDLIGDFTRPFALPLTAGKHQDLKCITPQTLVELISGKYDHAVEKYTIVDCRYPYEYEYGHIVDAQNLWTKDMVWNSFMEGRKKLQAPSVSESSAQGKKREILIFHCEFSSERGPALSRYLRNKDRDDNKDNYPALHWPEIYLLHGGYKAFYEQCEEWCTPRAYRPMNLHGWEEELRKCRAKTKSCNGEGKSGRPLTKSTSRRLELL